MLGSRVYGSSQPLVNLVLARCGCSPCSAVPSKTFGKSERNFQVQFDQIIGNPIIRGTNGNKSTPAGQL